MEKLLLLFVMLASIDPCNCWFNRAYYLYSYNGWPPGYLCTKSNINWKVTTTQKTPLCCCSGYWIYPHVLCPQLTVFEKNNECARDCSGICRCDPSVTACFDTTTTTTTTTAAPAPAKPKTSTSRKRGIGSLRRRRAVSQADKDLCPASGVIRFTGVNNQLCNGLLGYNLTTRSSQIYVTDVCRKRMLFVDSLHYLLNNGTYKSIELPNPADTEFTALGNNMSSFAPPKSLDGTKCKKKSTVYDPTIKGDKIDPSKCHVTTFDDRGEDGVTLDKMRVRMETSCQTATVTEDAQCFIAKSKNARRCSGDSGSPVHCRLKKRKKTVVYGLLDDIDVLPGDATDDNDDNLCADNNEFYVLPFN